MKGLPKEVDALAKVIQAVSGLEEPQKKWVFASALSNLGIDGLPVPGRATGTGAGNGLVTPAAQGLQSFTQTAVGSQPTPKEFLRAKSPQTAVQTVACLAYYLTHYRNEPHFKTRDLTNLNTEAAGIKIGNPAQAVDNATKQSRYLTAAGAGKKQITSVGEDVVNALPDQEKVKLAEQAKPKARRVKRKAKAKA